MIIDKNSVIQIFGSLMKHTQYLSETDKYLLTLDDFNTRFDKYIFAAIDSLYRNGAMRIQPIDVENYLQSNGAAAALFKKNNGIEYLQDADFLSEEKNFTFYYKRLKKVNLLNQLQKQGINTEQFYIEDLTKPEALEVNRNFEELEVEDILEEIKKKLLLIEHDFIQNEVTQTESAFTNIQEIIDAATQGTDIGVRVKGDI